MRALATSGAAARAQLPEVPTFKELGYDIEGQGWYAAYAPAGRRSRRRPVVQGDHPGAPAPDVREKLQTFGMEPTGHGPAELARIHQARLRPMGPGDQGLRLQTDQLTLPARSVPPPAHPDMQELMTPCC